ncbi:MAG TPA: TonB-dependent receptor [Telluria sp.]|nr:TonB-dependent receptor [Telluria sp.]
MRYTPIYLACAVLAQTLPAAVLAAEPNDDQTAPAPAQAAPAATPPKAAVQVVETFGRGQSRQVQNISRSDMAKLVPGSSPFKAMEKLPGVSFQSADAFGIYEWSTRLSIRGFSQNQLGFTLDDIPLGDMSYGNHNGLHISRAISPENLVRVAVSQGAGGLGTASTSNLGGTVQFVMQDPSEAMGFQATETVGSENTSRTYARFDSGAFGNGTTFYLSGTRQKTDKWKGVGMQNQKMFNSKFVQPIGDHTLSGFFNYSDRNEVDYQDLSLEMTGRLGYDWDNYAPDWSRALAAAKGNYSGGVTTLDDAYYLGRGLRKDKLGALKLDLDFGDGFTAKASAYMHHNDGQGHWFTPYTPSSATVPISVRTSEYTIDRHGLIADLSWDFGNHAVRGGFWWEKSEHDFQRAFYGVSGYPDDSHFLTDPVAVAFKQKFDTTTTQFYLQDTMTFMEKRLKLNYGFKSPKATTDATSLVGTRAAGSITAKKSFLPQVGVFYSLGEGDEVFASASQNMRAYQPGVAGPFSQTQSAFNAGTPNLKPETSITTDFGWRFRRDGLQGSVALYHTDFSDRQLLVATCSGISGCPSTLVNVGKVATNGIEALAVFKLAKDLSWLNSATYNRSEYKSDYMDNGKLVPAAGKQVVDAPKTMFATELTWEDHQSFVRVGAKYTGERYYTFLNDQGVPAYTVATLSAGMKWKKLWMLKEASVQVHVNNLFDKTYLATIGSNGFVKSDPTGTFQTLLTGAPRQIFLSLSGHM